MSEYPIESFVRASREKFLNSSELPTVEELPNGKKVTGCSNTFESASLVLAGMSVSDKLELIRDIYESREIATGDFFEFSEAGNHAVGDLLDELITHALNDIICDDPVIKMRERSNLDTHSITYDNIHGEPQ